MLTMDCISATGTTQIIMPVDLARHRHGKLLPGARHIHDGVYSLPCKGENLPTLHFQISGEVFEVPPSFYILHEITPGRCMSGLAGVEVDDTTWILGDVFLRSVYSVSVYTYMEQRRHLKKTLGHDLTGSRLTHL